MDRQQQREALGVELARNGTFVEDLSGVVADTFGESMTDEDIRGTFRAWKAERAKIREESYAGSLPHIDGQACDLGA